MRYRGRAQRPSPTQNFVHSKQSNQPSNAMRGGMWNGRASRRTQGSITIQEDKTSAGIGTTVKHPPSERIEMASTERGSKCVTTGGRSGPPLHGIRQRKQHQIQKTNLPTRAHTKGIHRKRVRPANEPQSLGQPLSSSHPQYESHDPPHAPDGHHA